MLYFVNEYVMAMNSGIEHAEFQRLKMFTKANVPTQIVTRNYDRLTHQYVERFELPSDGVLNMFDYFQDAIDVPKERKNYPKIESLDLAAEYNVDPGANVSHVYDGDRLVYDVYFTPGTVGQLYAVDVYNNTGLRMQSTLYDYRGFKSREQFFDQVGNLITQYSYSPTGERKIEEFFAKNDQGQSYMSLIHLLDYQNQDLYFNSYNELFVYFLNELNRTNPGSIFVADRPGSVYDSVLEMENNPVRFATLPTPHTANPTDQVYADLSEIYANVLIQHADRLNGVIVATEEQEHDLTRWMGGPKRLTTPIHQAAFGNIAEEQLMQVPKPLAERTSHKLIFVGRATDNQRLEKLISVFKLVRAQVSDATLDIYGYGDVIKPLQDQLKKDELDEIITFKGYQPDLSTAYDSAQLLISATLSDAQSLAEIEALGHGTPIVAFNTKYGPVGIVNDTTGKLIPDGDETAMAAEVVKLLSDPTLWNIKSKGALKQARNFSSSVVLKQWQAALM